MKKNLLTLTLLLLFFSTYTNAQDILYSSDGSTRKVFVEEINDSVVIFKEPSDGKKYKLKRSVISKIIITKCDSKISDFNKGEVIEEKTAPTPEKKTYKLSQTNAERTIRNFLNAKAFNNGNSGDFNANSIATIDPISQFTENSANTIVKFNHRDAFTSSNVVLKFIFNKTIDDNWFMTSVEVVNGVGSDRMSWKIHEWKTINVAVTDYEKQIIEQEKIRKEQEVKQKQEEEAQNNRLEQEVNTAYVEGNNWSGRNPIFDTSKAMMYLYKKGNIYLVGLNTEIEDKGLLKIYYHNAILDNFKRSKDFELVNANTQKIDTSFKKVILNVKMKNQYQKTTTLMSSTPVWKVYSTCSFEFTDENKKALFSKNAQEFSTTGNVLSNNKEITDIAVDYAFGKLEREISKFFKEFTKK